MDFEPQAIIAKIKENKLAIPAIGVGVAIGLYLLYKNGSSEGVTNGIGNPTTTDVATTEQTPVSDSAGSSPDSGISDIQNQIAEVTSQQQGFMSSIGDALNQLSDSLFGALNQQGQALQDQLSQVSQDTPYYDDSYQPSELDAVGSLLSSGFSQLFDQLTVPTVSDFASYSPELHSDFSSPDLQQFFDPNKVVQKLQLIQQKATLKTPQTPTVVHTINVRNVGQSLGSSLKNLVTQIKLPAPIINTPSPYHASAFSAVNYGDLAGVSGYQKYASTAPKITGTQVVTNIIRKAGTGTTKQTQY